jgi:56kDa selenium binding protein (SBP56)
MWRNRVLALHQSLLHTFKQSRFIEGLAQETDCPRVNRPLSNPVVRESGNEDDRYAVIVSNQIVLQLDAGHAGHLCNRIGRAAGRDRYDDRDQMIGIGLGIGLANSTRDTSAAKASRLTCDRRWRNEIGALIYLWLRLQLRARKNIPRRRFGPPHSALMFASRMVRP